MKLLESRDISPNMRRFLYWLLANMIGWSLGLYAAALGMNLFGISGLLIGGTLAGAIVGGAQWLVMQDRVDRWGWLLTSAAGGFISVMVLGLLVVVWLVLTLLIGIGWTLLLMGAIFGGIFGWMQWRMVRDSFHERVLWWIAANLLAGALCAPLSLTGATFWLPIFCSPGPIAFGVITGYTLHRLLQIEETA